ncbi:Hypothetical protein A7982_02345 [Minicystis rosea]|nr:Hypothetical protein A7982_02345 [Minicystis rosea]
MPFKSIATPKKVHSLDAEIRGAAFLANPGLVAMVSNEPVRIGVVPTSGANGKTTNVSLDGAESVALLSRDVAVVRASDDAVWALLDITHTPKMDQVARDVRSLSMRPGGETALAIGWDGTATELRVNKHEVDARPFQLRGSVRACDVGDVETYVVVDGEGGGQLRVHPGATPEPGASLRCNLPNEAARLDRVRGGQRLVAVYKKGSRTVCLATGGPARLAAKLVELDGTPNDVAVLDTSMIAVFEDGRAALYDSEAIAAASDSGPITAKHTLSLPGRGEPTVVMLTAKGGSTMWVGTSGGDILTAAVLKKS